MLIDPHSPKHYSLLLCRLRLGLRLQHHLTLTHALEFFCLDVKNTKRFRIKLKNKPFYKLPVLPAFILETWDLLTLNSLLRRVVVSLDKARCLISLACSMDNL